MRRALSLVEAIIVIASAGVILSLVVPALAGSRDLSNRHESMVNLVTIGAAHAAYAADWNGRQVTVIDDALSSYGNSASEAFVVYEQDNGSPHPSLILGWANHPTLGPGEFRFPPTGGNGAIYVPITFTGPFQFYGNFRLQHMRPLHDYLGGRVYDPVFYPPNDHAPYAIVEPAFSDPWEFVFLDDLGGDLLVAPSSYCPSPAAMLHPDVMRHPDDGGWQDPWFLDHAFTSPSLYAASYAHLKTQLIEHHWLQNAPDDRCNPNFFDGTYGGCEPWYFNHSLFSAPVTLFYDMSARELPNSEVVAADAQIAGQTGSGLWSRDTPFGEGGYFGEYGFDTTLVSHHVLTTDGILGRDTIEQTGPAPFAPQFEMGASR